jgi:glycosyltransferase involved in cell wall biosynthesis
MGDGKMNVAPRLSVALPVYNGENYLAESLESLLGQTYENFELIISDNASTDGTAGICRRYEKQDSRIRYVRQPRNIGCAPNHNYVVQQARGELFKWVSHDDLYARDLLKRCVDALDEFPHVVLAHSWTATIEDSGEVRAVEYGLATASPSAPERFRSLLTGNGGDDTDGVVRLSVLRRTPLLASYHHADRTLAAELGLYGPFYQVPDWLYFRRDHATRAERAFKTVRAWCANQDPRRADPLRHPTIRLYAEYVGGFAAAIRRAPLPSAEKRKCYYYLVRWLAGRDIPGRARRVSFQPFAGQVVIPVDAVVAGRDNRNEPS